MGDADLAFTLRLALEFGLPALVAAVGFHALVPGRPKAVLATLVVIEACVSLPWYFLEGIRQGTGIEIGVPGALAGLLVGNLLAIPVARRLRSPVDRSVKS